MLWTAASIVGVIPKTASALLVSGPMEAVLILGNFFVQSEEVICGGRYLSGDDPMRVFAAGTPTNQMRIEVRWRSGKRSVVNGVKANRIYEVDEARAQ